MTVMFCKVTHTAVTDGVPPEYLGVYEVLLIDTELIYDLLVLVLSIINDVV